MRLRNVKNKDQIINNSNYLVNNPKEYKGKWQVFFANDNPIYLEIGMGKGDFIIENAYFADSRRDNDSSMNMDNNASLSSTIDGEFITIDDTDDLPF